eukprot:4223841-Alexandrium_andersonii.AAC.1
MPELLDQRFAILVPNTSVRMVRAKTQFRTAMPAGMLRLHAFFSCALLNEGEWDEPRCCVKCRSCRSGDAGALRTCPICLLCWHSDCANAL